MNKVSIKDIRKIDFHYEEAIKTLQTNIRFAGRNIATILVTSCYPNEGKSDISFSLAKEMANSGKRVLLIDADMRKSSFISRFQVQEKVSGLSQYLSGQTGVQDLIYQTNYLNLDIIFSGPPVPNPPGLLGSDAFSVLLKKIQEPYHYVFIDTPPIGSIIDAAVVAQQCDGAIMVVESEAVSRRILQKCLNQIRKSGCEILGGVLNKVDTKRDKYYASYYKKYDSYYNHAHKKQES